MEAGGSGQTHCAEDPQCYNCGGSGHWAIGCPEPTRQTPAGLEAWRSSSSSSNPGNNHQMGGKRDHRGGQRKSRGPIITKYAPPTPSMPYQRSPPMYDAQPSQYQAPHPPGPGHYTASVPPSYPPHHPTHPPPAPHHQAQPYSHNSHGPHQFPQYQHHSGYQPHPPPPPPPHHGYGTPVPAHPQSAGHVRNHGPHPPGPRQPPPPPPTPQNYGVMSPPSGPPNMTTGHPNHFPHPPPVPYPAPSPYQAGYGHYAPGPHHGPPEHELPPPHYSSHSRPRPHHSPYSQPNPDPNSPVHSHGRPRGNKPTQSFHPSRGQQSQGNSKRRAFNPSRSSLPGHNQPGINSLPPRPPQPTDQVDLRPDGRNNRQGNDRKDHHRGPRNNDQHDHGSTRPPQTNGRQANGHHKNRPGKRQRSQAAKKAVQNKERGQAEVSLSSQNGQVDEKESSNPVTEAPDATKEVEPEQGSDAVASTVQDQTITPPRDSQVEEYSIVHDGPSPHNNVNGDDWVQLAVTENDDASNIFDEDCELVELRDGSQYDNEGRPESSHPEKRSLKRRRSDSVGIGQTNQNASHSDAGRVSQLYSPLSTDQGQQASLTSPSPKGLERLNLIEDELLLFGHMSQEGDQDDEVDVGQDPNVERVPKSKRQRQTMQSAFGRRW